MPFTAKHNFARISPRKARLIVDLVRGRDVDDALALLKFSKQRASVMVEKVIRSAVANAAEQSAAPSKGVFYVSTCHVDPGPVIKRFMPKDRGKAYDIKKRTSHIVVTIDERAEGEEAPVRDSKGRIPKKANKQASKVGTEAKSETKSEAVAS